MAKLAESVPDDQILIVESNGHVDPSYGGSGTLTFKMSKKAEAL